MNRTGILLLLVSLPLMADDGIKVGKWEFTSSIDGMKMPQMPELPPGMKLPEGMQMPKFSNKGVISTHCVTKENAVPQSDANGDCKMTRMEQKGNTVNWSMVCKQDGGDMTGDGEATYTGDTVKSVVRMKGQSAHGPIDMTQRSSGRYLGPCN